MMLPIVFTGYRAGNKLPASSSSSSTICMYATLLFSANMSMKK